MAHKLTAFTVYDDQIIKTSVDGVFMLGGRLLISTRNSTDGGVEEFFHWSSGYDRQMIRLQLKGFWSMTTGRLCMVGNEKGNNMPRKLDELYYLN